MTDIAEIGFRADSRSLESAAKSLDRLEGSARRTETATERMNRESDQAVRQMREMEGMSGGLGRSLTRLGGIVAGVFAGFKLTEMIKETALANSRFEQLEIVAARVGRNVGLGTDQVQQYSREVQGMGISMTESRQTVIRMIQAQMDLSKASELARLAQDAAVIANTNSSDALGRLIYGLQSGQVEILRNMGLNANFASSYTQLAAEMGVTVNQLTEADKVQARTNAVMAAGVQIAGTYEASMDSASKQLGSTTRYVQDLQVMIGGLFSDAARQEFNGTPSR